MRDDLKQIKAQHFRNSYQKHVLLPKKYMENSHFGKEELDANKYFQMKYFLRDEEKLAAVKQKVHDINLAKSRREEGESTPEEENIDKATKQK